MKKLLCIAVCLLPALLYAQSPFDGTWKTDMSKSKLSPKPNIFSIKGGMFDCESCVPKYSVKADGKDQMVKGQSFDTIAVQAPDPNTVKITVKNDGKVTGESTRMLSSDGKTLTITGKNTPPNGQPVNYEVKLTRVAKGPAGSTPTSGSWRVENVKQDDPALTTTWKVSGDEVMMTSGTGESWTAKAGGGDAPVKGSYYKDETVSVKKLGPHEMEVTYHRDGKPFTIEKMTVSADGKKLTNVVENKWNGRISTYVDEKQ